MIDHDEIRQRLRSRLDALELSHTGKWLKDYGVGQTTVRNFLDGTNKSVTIETISKLAEPLGVDEAWLILGEDPALRLPSAAVLTSAFAVLLDSVGVDPYQNERAQKLAAQFPDALQSIADLRSRAVSAPETLHEAASPPDDEERPSA